MKQLVVSIVTLLQTPYAKVFSTLMFNFKYLPFQQAKFLPVFIYGHTNINVRGGVKLAPTFFTPSMIRVGVLKNSFFGNKPWMQTVIAII